VLRCSNDLHPLKPFGVAFEEQAAIVRGPDPELARDAIFGAVRPPQDQRRCPVDDEVLVFTGVPPRAEVDGALVPWFVGRADWVVLGRRRGRPKQHQRSGSQIPEAPHGFVRVGLVEERAIPTP
jgi:hypothetical protein